MNTIKKLGLLSFMSALIFASSNIFSFNIGYGATVKNYTKKYISVSVKPASILKKQVDLVPETTEKTDQKFLPSGSGPREFFWTVRSTKDGKVEKTYKTAQTYNHPHELNIQTISVKGKPGNEGEYYVIVEKPENKETVIRTQAIDLTPQEIVPLEKVPEENKDPKTKLTIKLTEAQGERLKSLLKREGNLAVDYETLKKYDAELKNFIDKLNLYPNYKYMSLEILIPAAYNLFTETINYLIKKGVDFGDPNLGLGIIRNLKKGWAKNSLKLDQGKYELIEKNVLATIETLVKRTDFTKVINNIALEEIKKELSNKSITLADKEFYEKLEKLLSVK
jgi:hypothetical protein